MKIYVAGPMSGLPELNHPAFHAATKALRDAGYTVVNPAELNKNPNACWYECMRVDIRELVTCDSICLLPNWTMSRGARLEFHVATQLSMQILEAATFIPSLNGEMASPLWIGIDRAAGKSWTARRQEHVHVGDHGPHTGAPT